MAQTVGGEKGIVARDKIGEDFKESVSGDSELSESLSCIKEGTEGKALPGEHSHFQHGPGEESLSAS